MSRSGKAVAGADTHADTFSVGVVGTDGVRIDVASFPATGAGFAKLGDWLEGLGVEIVRFGVEGSGGLGVHLAAYLVGAGFDVREVPGLRTGQLRRQRHRPKTDHEDSVSVALATLADPNLGPADLCLSFPRRWPVE